MGISRRELLAISSSWLFAESLSHVFPGISLLPRASATPWLDSEPTDHFFVLLRTFGAMDVTLGLDPQVLPSGADSQDLFLEYRPDEIVHASGLRLGPAARALVPFAPQCLVINGVMMRRDAGHDVINLYMATGNGDGKSASVPIELALSLGAGPFGVIINSPPYLAGKPAAVSATKDLLTDTDQGALIEKIEERLKVFAATHNTPLEEAEKKLVEGKASALKMMEILKGLGKQVGKLRDQHAVAAALASGAARQAQLDVPIPAPGLDTHSNHEGNHLKVQKAVWDFVADTFATFQKIPYGQGSLFDATTFMVMSEFSRTPALNAAKGKDHNPFTNSVLLAGKGIRGGNVVGASRLLTRKQTGLGMPDHIAWPFDYKANKLAESPKGASFFFPENVIQTIGQIFGSPANFHPVPKNTLVIPGVCRA